MERPAQPLNVLMIGTGMYVCGRGTSGFGTVLPAVVQAKIEGRVREIWVAGASPTGIEVLRDKLAQLNSLLHATVSIQAAPERGRRDPMAYREMLRAIPRPAAAVIAVPDHLHASIAEDVIRAGLHALVVKPLAPTLAEAARLVELAEENGIYGAVDFHKRFDEANGLLRQTIEDGRLGALRYLTVEYSQRRKIREAFQPWIEQTNVFQYLGVHYVDLVHFLTGARPVRVLATGQPRASVSDALWRLDAIQALVEWRHPVTEESFASLIMTNWIDPDRSSAMSDQNILVVGTAGRYQSDQKHRGVQLTTQEEGVEDLNPYFNQLYAAPSGELAVHGYGPRSIWQFLSDVQDLIRGGRSLKELVASRPSFQAALVSTAVIEAVNRSLAQDEAWVAVDDVPVGGAVER